LYLFTWMMNRLWVLKFRSIPGYAVTKLGLTTVVSTKPLATIEVNHGSTFWVRGVWNYFGHPRTGPSRRSMDSTRLNLMDIKVTLRQNLAFKSQGDEVAPWLGEDTPLVVSGEGGLADGRPGPCTGAGSGR
jgi:hypothetical protein